MTELILARHGETEWSRDGRHTGRTDVPLTANGRDEAERLREPLAGRGFTRVLSSPLSRAVDTARLAGFGEVVETRDDLLEWDYGEYEGITTATIREGRPGWLLWRDGCPGGESADQVGARVDRVLAELDGAEGDALLFAHGHVLRVLTARWLDLDPDRGQLYALGTGTLSTLGFEHEYHVIRAWNAPIAPG